MPWKAIRRSGHPNHAQLKHSLAASPASEHAKLPFGRRAGLCTRSILEECMRVSIEYCTA
jgi:hypothetical protein